MSMAKKMISRLSVLASTDCVSGSMFQTNGIYERNTGRRYGCCLY